MLPNECGLGPSGKIQCNVSAYSSALKYVDALVERSGGGGGGKRGRCAVVGDVCK